MPAAPKQAITCHLASPAVHRLAAGRTPSSLENPVEGLREGGDRRIHVLELVQSEQADTETADVVGLVAPQGVISTSPTSMDCSRSV